MGDIISLLGLHKLFFSFHLSNIQDSDRASNESIIVASVQRESCSPTWEERVRFFGEGSVCA